jgi:hypothetical protein
MKNEIKYIIIASLLIFPFLNYGQSTLKVANGGTLNITSETSVKSNNTTISTSGQINNWGNLTVNGVLANSAGTPGLSMKANQNGNGSLLHNTANVPASMEQYLSSERWHLVSSPIANSTIATYMDIYLKQWNETDSTWTYLSQPTTIPMNATQGYASWASDALTNTTTVNYEGNLNNGDYNINLVYTLSSNATGWNLLGNPYPSALDWNADTSWNRTSVGGWAVIYDNGTNRGWNPLLTGTDRSWNGKTDGIIPATQGFWVRAYASGASMTIPQSQRTHNDQLFYKDAEESTYMSLRIKATANNYEDEAAIIFMTGATNGFDGLYDLEKFYNINEAPNIYSVAEGNYYAVNVLEEDFIEQSESPVIPVGFKLGLEKECLFTVTGIESFDLFTPIYLEDLQEDVLVDLRYQNTYSFTTNPTDNVDRFLLHFGEPIGVDENLEAAIKIYSNESSVYINLPENSTGTADIYDMLGKKIHTLNLNTLLTKHTIGQTGYFVVNVITNNGIATQKVYIRN